MQKLTILFILLLGSLFGCKDEIAQPVGASNMQRVASWGPCAVSPATGTYPFYERSNATVCTNDNTAYIIGGGALGSGMNRELWVFNPANLQLNLIQSNIPQFLIGGISFFVDDKLYYGLGLGQGGFNNVIWYKTVANSWASMSPFPGGGRSNAISFTIAEKAYVGLGRGESSYYRDLYEFDPALNTWKKMADMPGGGRTDASVFVLNNKAYVGTGYDGTYYLRDFYAFDPKQNKWERIPDLPGLVRDDAVGFAFEKRGYIGTGWNPESGILSDFYEYNPLTNQWKSAPQINAGARFGAIAFTFNGRAFIGTGNNATDLNDFYVSK